MFKKKRLTPRRVVIKDVKMGTGDGTKTGIFRPETFGPGISHTGKRSDRRSAGTRYQHYATTLRHDYDSFLFLQAQF
jgi:hypothetical protein